MKFTDLLSDAQIVVADAPAEKTAAIRLLIETLHERGVLERPADALSMVLEREAEYPTGIGCGVAIPHGNTWPVDEPIVAIGLFRPGLDFGAPDGQAASVLVLLLTATGMTSMHLKLLARISRLAKHGLAERLESLATAEEILHAVENCEHDFLDI
ncbi:MAG: PTS sugar transporter subunit IIA [Calditrichaeota bacterium]|nr:PTS sugar transporter subunit IIA [Candidatus Cloacimonadota bacterium]MCA9787173.1 PTS sugar transporter subunit IIA [Candidatus Cloacimonadota bacterium]MCB1047818.1 PTS sugar transporter subunit IIA [Calditrichota bacterium]MCB9474908.1 PTS sugar transporter subunit IIA [Candidatus Delongbacteria bacterium]